MRATRTLVPGDILKDEVGYYIVIRNQLVKGESMIGIFCLLHFVHIEYHDVTLSEDKMILEYNEAEAKI